MARYGPIGWMIGSITAAVTALAFITSSASATTTTSTQDGWLTMLDGRIVISHVEGWNERIDLLPAPAADYVAIHKMPWSATPMTIDHARKPHHAAAALKPTSLAGWRSGRVRKLAA